MTKPQIRARIREEKTMKRIKLFGSPDKKTRLRLFGEPESCHEKHPHHHILVCQDCGFKIEDPGTGSTKEYCPQCGSSRFNYLETMPAAKEFSGTEKKRISLFSGLTRIQPNTTGEGTDNGFVKESKFKCTDCGAEFTVEKDVFSGQRCPSCGGNRVVRVSHEYTYSDSTDTTGEFLKRAAGQSMSQEDAQKLFSECGAQGSLQDLVDSGYAHVGDNHEVSFSEHADSEYALFSKLVISVTKELDLDPVLPGSQEDLIQSLEGGSIPPKGIILIKKAHGILPHQSDIVPETDYIKDSGIGHDLKLEHGGETIGLSDFLGMLKTRYNDAPDDLLDQLVKKGIVGISGSQVAIK